MTDLISINENLTMSSQEISIYTEKQHQHVKRDIEKMMLQLEIDTSTFGRIYKDSMNRNQTEYVLDRDQTDCLLTGYSAKARMAVIKRWKELEFKPKPMTQMQMVAFSAQAIVKIESQVIEHKALIDAQSDKINQLEESYSILPSKPANAESITYIRVRINKQYGLPARIVNEVLYSIYYAPKQAGQVRNTNENANSSTYTVWSTSEVTKLFKRFTSECEHVTKTMAVHPAIDGRFKLIQAEK